MKVAKPYFYVRQVKKIHQVVHYISLLWTTVSASAWYAFDGYETKELMKGPHHILALPSPVLRRRCYYWTELMLWKMGSLMELMPETVSSREVLEVSGGLAGGVSMLDSMDTWL